MTEIRGCYLTGRHPQREESIDISKRYTRTRKLYEVMRSLREESRRVITLQEELGYVWTDDGQFFCDDLLRPIVRNTSWMSVGPLDRWFDTNTFYRKPKVRRRTFSYQGRSDDVVSTSSSKVDLPGPYTFAHASQLPHNYNKTDFLKDVAIYLGNIARQLFENGIEMVNLKEPALAYNASHGVAKKSDVNRAVRAVNKLVKIARSGNSHGTISLHTFFGDFSLLCPSILDCNVDIFGIDMLETEPNDLPRNDLPHDKEYALGVVDAQDSLIEKPKHIAEYTETAAKKTRGTGIYIVPTCDLEHVSLRIAEAKMRNMTKAARLMRGE